MITSSTRVLHAPIEIAGQLMLSVVGQRELGIHATGLAYRHRFGYAFQPDLTPRHGRVGLFALAAGAIRSHDVVHFYFGSSFLPRQLDIRWLKRLGKRVIVEFLGSDIRMPTVEAQRNPYYVQIDWESDRRAQRIMRAWSRATQGHVVVADHSLDAFLKPYFTHIHVVGQRVAICSLPPSPPDPNAPQMRIVHSPTDVAAKGTEFIRGAVKDLQQRGAPIDYVEVQGLTHSQAREIYRTADLIVDQLCSGSHGVFAAEAMGLAKPVVCYLLPEIEATYPSDLPIINANPATITEKLAYWVDRPKERYELGLASRAYAERVHDHRAVARRLLDVYERLP